MTSSFAPAARASVVAVAVALTAACATRPESANSSTAKPGFQRADSAPSGHGARKVGEIQELHGPESVKYDSLQDVYFISNMYGYGSAKDGNGYIVQVDASDFAKDTVLIQGGVNGVTLDAPKGMAIHGDTLWVADIQALRGFDRRTGAPLATIDLASQHAVLLNDVVVGPDGSIYITDSGIIMSDKGVLYPGGDKIFVVGPDRAVSVMAQGPQLARPNGITWDANGKRLVVVNFDPFKSEVYAMKPGDSTRTLIATGKGKFDGVEILDDGRLLVASWSDSSIHAFANGKDVQMVHPVPEPADIGVDTKRHRLAIPLSTGDRVQFWDIEGIRVAKK